MRAIAACQFTLSRFEVWRCSVAALAVSVVIGLSLWGMLRSVPLHWDEAVAIAGVALASLALGATLLRTPPVCLRWDGREWHSGPAGSDGHESTAGSVSVEIDLGNWMLLQFRADEASHRPRAVWLPVQRRGLESQWHSLRCAVYSPRPARDAAHGAGVAADL